MAVHMNTFSVKTYLLGAGSGLGLMLANIVVAIFFMPYLFGYYGAEGFGVISMSMHFFSALALFCSSVSVALNRFYVVDFNKGNKYLSGLFIYSLLIVLVLSVLGVAAAIAIGELYIPLITAKVDDFSTLFYLMALSSILFSFQQVFSVVFYVNHEIYLQNILQIFNVIVRVLLVVLSIFFGLAIASYGWAYLISSFLVFCVVIIYSRKLGVSTDIKFNAMPKVKLEGFRKVMLWLGINNFSALLIRNVDLFIVGYYLLGETQGLYALALQWIVVIRVFSEALSVSISPKIVETSRDVPGRLYESVQLASKAIGSIVAYPVMFLMVFTSEIWELWLGAEGAFMSDYLFIQVLLLSVLFYGCFFPYVYSQVALNKVRVPALVGIFIGVLYVLALVVIGEFGFGLEYFALSLVLAITLKNTIFTPIYGAYITGSDYKTALSPVLRVAGMALLSCITLLSCGHLFGGAVTGLLFSFFIGGVIYLSVCCFVVFSRQERSIAYQLWKKT